MPGETWDTARTLRVGWATDPVSDPDRDGRWWKFTPATTQVLVIDSSLSIPAYPDHPEWRDVAIYIYTGADEGSSDRLISFESRYRTDGFSNVGLGSWTFEAGVEYHFYVSISDVAAVILTFTEPTYGDWIEPGDYIRTDKMAAADPAYINNNTVWGQRYASAWDSGNTFPLWDSRSSDADIRSRANDAFGHVNPPDLDTIDTHIEDIGVSMTTAASQQYFQPLFGPPLAVEGSEAESAMGYIGLRRGNDYEFSVSDGDLPLVAAGADYESPMAIWQRTEVNTPMGYVQKDGQLVRDAATGFLSDAVESSTTPSHVELRIGPDPTPGSGRLLDYKDLDPIGDLTLRVQTGTISGEPYHIHDYSWLIESFTVEDSDYGTDDGIAWLIPSFFIKDGSWIFQQEAWRISDGGSSDDRSSSYLGRFNIRWVDTQYLINPFYYDTPQRTDIWAQPRYRIILPGEYQISTGGWAVAEDALTF